MKKRWSACLLTAFVSVSLLSACNLGNDDRIEPYQNNNGPVRFDDVHRDNINGFDNGFNRNGLRDRNDDMEMFDVGNDRRNLNNRAPNWDLGANEVRNRNEVDTPFNMDEEEPDLDEEPSEEFRD